ncbi:MAG TPA: amidase [Gemmatimonadaceae bacterium]|nr:amidase [Gemmatimonadaceae bacterium]
MPGMDRREFLGTAAAGLALPAIRGRDNGTARDGARVPAPDAQTGAAQRAQAAAQPDPLFERSVADLGADLRSGALTSRRLVQRYVTRIAAMDKSGPAVNAVIELNPDALAIADRMDAELKAGRPRGPLHGIPVLVKDNIDSADRMRTTAGSLALAGSTPPRDAYIVERLRAAGAVLLGKTNLSEWANYRSTRSSSGWSGRGGQTRNPYVLDRNPCGSSSGTAAAIAADFATVGIGTETDGSIICPSGICGLVGVKPTVGLWSRAGIIPISASQDTAGPMARSVADAAALLGALAGVDPRDPATRDAAHGAQADYTKFLDAGGLKGARIGVARNLAGFHPDVDRRFDDAIAAMRAAGAVIVDPANLTTAGRFGDAETTVLDYEFKAGVTAYLAALGAAAPARTLADLIAFNAREAAREMPFFGQEIFVRAQKAATLADRRYRDARALCVKLARTEGIDATMTRHHLDAIVLPSNAPAWVTDHVNGDHVTGGDTSFAAVAGYPSVTVPMGLVSELPVGLSFVGRAWTEGPLLRLAYAFERATRLRRPPRFLPSVA